MEWEFTPEQVIKAEVDYSLEQFRKDMLEEVRLNLSQMDDVQQQKIFSVMYDLCYWVATGGEFEEFLAGLDKDSFFPGFLASIQDRLAPNIKMLGAILQRLIMERVDEQGIPLEAALKQVYEFHRQVVTKPLLN